MLGLSADYEISAALPPDEVRRRLAARLAQRGGSSEKPAFTGSVAPRSFRMERTISLWSREAFPPTILGRIEPDGTGTRIQGKVEANPLQALPVALAVGVLGTGSLTLLGQPAMGIAALPACLVPLALLLGAYGATRASVRADAVRAGRFLEQVLAETGAPP